MTSGQWLKNAGLFRKNKSTKGLFRDYIFNFWEASHPFCFKLFCSTLLEFRYRKFFSFFIGGYPFSINQNLSLNLSWYPTAQGCMISSEVFLSSLWIVIYLQYQARTHVAPPPGIVLFKKSINAIKIHQKDYIFGPVYTV